MASEILVKINVESGQADVSLKKAKASSDKLSKSFGVLANQTNEVDKAQASLRGEQKLATEQQKRLSYEMQNAGKIASTYELSTRKAAGGTKQFRTQVGLNNAILTEAGRAASDLRFGFNGVANNVGQMASLFGSLINTSDNLATSMKNLFKSLAGTGGIMIAIQLLIAYGDQIYKFFHDAATNAGILTEAFKDASKAVSSTVGNFELYIRTLQDSSKSQQEHKDAIHELNREFPDFISSLQESEVSLQDVKKGTEDAILVTDLYRKSIQKLAFAQAARAKFAELESQALQIRLDRDTRAIENGFTSYEQAVSVANGTQEKSDEIIAKSQTSQVNYVDTVLEKAKDIKGMRQDELDDIETNTKILLSYIDIVVDLDNKTTKSNRDPKVFEQKLLQLEQIEQRYREKSINNDLKTNEERINIFEENELAKLDIRIKNFKERRALTLQNYKDDINNLKISNEEKQKLIEDAEKKHTEEVAKADNDRAKVKEQIEAVGDLKLKRLIDKEAQIRRASSLREVEILKFSLGNNEAYYEAKSALLKKNIEAEEDIVNSFGEGTTERANAEAQLFKTRDALRQNELQQEVAAIEEKTRVQQAYVGYVSGISGVLKTLAGENEALQKVALVLEKGAAIAGIVIGANKSIANSVANTAAANTAASTMMTIPGMQAAGAAAIARNKAALVKEVLMTKVSAGIGIASILATSLTSAKSPSGGAGGGGGGVSVTAPAFNVVGASATNQLAGAVAGQVNAPLRAYVVGSDISDQQELDRSIISTAGIG